jgi:hypothetical protein
MDISPTKGLKNTAQQVVILLTKCVQNITERGGVAINC